MEEEKWLSDMLDDEGYFNANAADAEARIGAERTLDPMDAPMRARLQQRLEPTAEADMEAAGAAARRRGAALRTALGAAALGAYGDLAYHAYQQGPRAGVGQQPRMHSGVPGAYGYMGGNSQLMPLGDRIG